MPYTIEWLVPDRVILTRLIDVVTTGEIAEAHHKNLDYAAKGQAPVHSIVDATGLQKLDVKISEMSKFADVSAADEFGWTYIVTDNSFVKFLTTIFAKFTWSRYATVATYDDALLLLRRQAPDLTIG